MKKRNQGRWLALAATASMVLAGCGTASAKTIASAPAGHSASHPTMATNSPASSNSMSQGTTSSGMAGSLKGIPSDILIGAAASPPSGPGNGTLSITNIGMKRTWTVPLAANANAFQVAIGHGLVYVPTLGGKTYIVSIASHKVVSSFNSPLNVRIATLAEADHLLILTSATSVTAYSPPSDKPVWKLPKIGGNTLAVAGQDGYLSSTGSSSTAIIDLKNGHVVKTIPVGQIENSVYDPQHHTLWLADWFNGDMTIVNTMTNRIVRVSHQAEGGGFSMSNKMSAPGGFMQLAVSPSGQSVYAASFSGNIMVYNAETNRFQKNIPVKIPMAKLSGLAIDPSGQYAYTTVESDKETVALSLKTGQIVGKETGLMSNRWFVTRH
ncbi:hypothetical protein [Sulfobacillus harzensis]|uniref:Uncharacterized protein n=1 Tax=Sulfobacillus harzensis TaxID=2729629 RepID=A0A7Y0L980_9FIRM|nr:hypothetical protein [Sulfobacillus harzensis]NMP24840.1 hypothetical protein [Sulfobacillus harzensis]